jgi:hypothetical protein
MAMTRRGFSFITPIKKHGDSNAFCPIMLELSKEIKKLESFKKGRLVIIMDNATFHWCKQTRAHLKPWVFQ